jgi:hypothetical protein
MKALTIITLKRRLTSKVKERLEVYRQIEDDQRNPNTVRKLKRLSDEINRLKEMLKPYP